MPTLAASDALNGSHPRTGGRKNRMPRLKKPWEPSSFSWGGGGWKLWLSSHT